MSTTYLNDTTGATGHGHFQEGGVAGLAKAALTGVVGQLLIWQARAAERRHLEDLDDRLLGDAGLDREQARLEAAKPFWIA